MPGKGQKRGRREISAAVQVGKDRDNMGWVRRLASPMRKAWSKFTFTKIKRNKRGPGLWKLYSEFVETDLAKKVPPRIIELSGGFLSMDMVIKGAFELIEDETKAGQCLWITKRRGFEYWPTPEEKKKYLTAFAQPRKNVSSTTQARSKIMATISDNFDKLVVHRLDSNFRQATKIVRTSLKLPTKAGHVLIKNIYAGVNASDAVGIIAAIGDFVEGLSVGAPVAAMTFGAYAEFTEVPAKHVIPVPRPDPEVVAMLTSGLTASIGLEQAGFFLLHYSHLWRGHLERLYNLYTIGKLKVALDHKQFLGVKSVVDAVEYLHSGQSLGKVVVCIDPSYSQVTARL